MTINLPQYATPEPAYTSVAKLGCTGDDGRCHDQDTVVLHTHLGRRCMAHLPDDVQHRTTPDCWCRPTIALGSRETWVHNNP